MRSEYARKKTFNRTKTAAGEAGTLSVATHIQQTLKSFYVIGKEKYKQIMIKSWKI